MAPPAASSRQDGDSKNQAEADRASWGSTVDENPAGLSEFALAQNQLLKSLENEQVEAWIPLTAEEVLSEKEAGLKRLTRIRRIVSTQEHVVRQIHAKLGQTDLHEARWSPTRAVASTSPVTDADGMTLLGSKERQSGARVLSEELLKRENKAVRFKARREALHAQACKEHEDMQAKLAAADVRWAQRREQLNSEQRRRTYTKKQQRTEHQKAVKDNLRDSDTALLAAMEKGHTKYGDAASRPSSQPSLRRIHSHSGMKKDEASQPLAATQPSLNLSRACAVLDSPAQLSAWRKGLGGNTAGENVLLDQMSSHQLYCNTLDRWSQYVAENDRRTEAMWVKMTGAPAVDRGKVNARRSSKGNKASLLDSEDVLDSSKGDTQRKSVFKVREGQRLSTVHRGQVLTRENSPDSSPLRKSVLPKQRRPGDSVVSAWLEA
mmetsp:Transcript_3668/g.9315  ORF Transcript_3668/g.9315 Transcript_3668/m.9315 type:complete len:435 (+) Transcript_3668:33-1337(+)